MKKRKHVNIIEATADERKIWSLEDIAESLKKIVKILKGKLK